MQCSAMIIPSHEIVGIHCCTLYILFTSLKIEQTVNVAVQLEDMHLHEDRILTLLISDSASTGSFLLLKSTNASPTTQWSPIDLDWTVSYPRNEVHFPA